MNGRITPTLALLAALLLASPSVARAADELVVYPPVPGLAASEHYRVRVRSASDGREWQSAFAWKTVCKTIEKKTDAYFDTLAGWTHTYVNFETAGAVEIEVARVNGQRIRAAAVHPLRKASACSVKDGKVLVEVKWTKIFTWRANGDGINPFGNTLIEDCFLRTQDDSLYVSGLGIRRTVLWNDANGSSFVLSGLPQLADRKLVVEDCDVIYARAKWHHWSGGRVFNMRGEGGRAAGAGVIFRNINIEDPRPTLQQFFICMTMPKPYSRTAETRAAGDLSGILFQNISIAAPSVLGEPQILWGQADARIRHLTFENLTLAGKPVRDSEFFKTNEFVDGLIFAPSTGSNP